MHIGILTFHCAYNFGSALQAWALKLQLEKRGFEVRTVDYRGDDFDQYELVCIDSVRRAVISLLTYFRNRRMRNSFESFISFELAPTERRYGVDDEPLMEKDLVGGSTASYVAAIRSGTLTAHRAPSPHTS